MKPKQLNQTLFTVNEAKALFKKVKKPYDYKNTEDYEQGLLCKWVKATYPNVLYTVDLAAGKRSKAEQSVMSTRSKKGHPDLIFQEWFKDIFCGLAIEFKKTGVIIQNKDGTLRKDTHLEEQMAYLLALKERCYVAGFVVGLQAAKSVISAYLEASDKSIEIINRHIFPKIK